MYVCVCAYNSNFTNSIKIYRSYIDEIKQEIKSPSEENIRKNKKLENVPRNIAPKENPGKNILLSGKKSRFSKPVEQ